MDGDDRRQADPAAARGRRLSRFEKGRSGNPNGRPRKGPAPRASAFDIVIDQELTVTQGGHSREFTVEEGLQLSTYKAALGGNGAARGKVMKMITKREQWLASRRPSPAPLPMLTEIDPRNANEALVILGIASLVPKTDSSDPYDRYLLEPWAVEAAVRRSSRQTLSAKDLLEIRRCTRDHKSLPRPVGDGR